MKSEGGERHRRAILSQKQDYHFLITASEEVRLKLARAQILKRGGRFAVPVPDGLMAVVFGLAAVIDFLPASMLAAVPFFLLEAREQLIFGLMVEGGFLMMQGTLVDIATRLKKRPPVWAIVLIVAAVALFSGESLALLGAAWQHGGAVVLLPLLLSLAERGTVLWTMPNRSTIEKIAERALIANRITTGLALAGLVTVAMLVGVAFPNRFDSWTGASWPFLAAGAIYFAVAAYDDWRVRGAKFAERPRVLFRYDPIGIDYLAPL